MALVAGIDSSTQSCKVVIRDAASGILVREGRAPHPDGTEVDPAVWERALIAAIGQAGGLDDVDGVSVAAQQHGMVCLDERGAVVRPALLWNDTRSADAAAELVADLGADAWADAVGSVPVASFTVTKLRWLATHEPEVVERVAAVCLPHDWLTWRLGGSADLGRLATDRGDASGTGYWSPVDGYRRDLLRLALGRDVHLPEVLAPMATAGDTPGGALLAAGTGDNMAAALGVQAGPGDVIVSIGSSGVVSGISPVPTRDHTGTVAGFADATGAFLPLACTLNAAPVLSAVAAMLGVTLDELSELALSVPPGADGLVLVPYLDGERTPDLPHAAGALHGLRRTNTTPAHVARAAVEGLLCGLRDGMTALERQGLEVRRVVLIGGGARSSAVRAIAPTVLGHPVTVPEPGEHVADGAARQAAWALAGGDAPPVWPAVTGARYEGELSRRTVEQYAEARPLVVGHDQREDQLGHGGHEAHDRAARVRDGRR